MAQQDTINWTPYANQGEAAFCMGRFANKAVSTELGLIWCGDNACTLLRDPKYDADGYGYVLMLQWSAALPPPPPEPKTFWQKVEKLFEDSMEMQMEANEMEMQGNLAMWQSISGWFANKDNEHKVGLLFDVIGVVGFVCLFIPGIGEAEMGLIAAARAGEVLLTVGRVTAAAAATGSALGAVVDGRYLGLRYLGGGSQAQREEAAKQWDDSRLASNMSIAAAILALPDFAVGGVMTLKDLSSLPGAVDKAGADAAKLREAAAPKLAKADELRGRIQNEPAWMKPKLENKAANIAQRAAKLTKRAEEADRKAKVLTNKLLAAMLINAPATFVGTPQAEAYFVHDNHDWLGSLLMPHRSKNEHAQPGHFTGQIGVVSRTRNDN